MRRTMAARALAAALLADPDAQHWGYALSRQTGIPAGVLYPILTRMRTQNWITAEWAEPNGAYPRRRYYRLTDDGRSELPAFVAGASS